MSAAYMEEKNYTLKEAADILRLNVRSVRNEIARGNLTAFRSGGQKILVSGSEIEAYKRRNRIQTGENGEDAGKKVA